MTLDWKIMSADESQIEMRIAAWLADEKTMLRFFEKDIDIHKATAGWIKALAQGVTLTEYRREILAWVGQVSEDERFRAKGVGFGFLFGMREEHFIDYAKTDYGLDFTMPQATEVRSGFFTLYHALEPWHEAAWEWVRKGYVDTCTGRRRMLPQGEDELAQHRKAINTPVQGPASDLALLAYNDICSEIGARGLSDVAIPFGFFHDAVLLEVRDDAVEEVEAIVRQSMEHPPLHLLGWEFPVPLVADVKVGQTWVG